MRWRGRYKSIFNLRHILCSSVYTACKLLFLQCRANKDKDQLESRLRSAQKSATSIEAPIIARTNVPALSAAPPGVTPHIVQDLKRRVHDLEDEVSRSALALNKPNIL